MNPGAHELLVSWSDGRNESVSINATEGGSETLHLDPPVPPAPVPPAPAPVPPPGPAPLPQTPPQEATAPPPATKPFGPAVFITGAALTGVGLGVTVWSGIYTLNNPGKDAVKVACVGQTEACWDVPSACSTTRTNVLIGVTGGRRAVTAVVGIFFTRRVAGSRSGRGCTSSRVGLRAGRRRGTFSARRRAERGRAIAIAGPYRPVRPEDAMTFGRSRSPEQQARSRRGRRPVARPF